MKSLYILTLALPLCTLARDADIYNPNPEMKWPYGSDNHTGFSSYHRCYCTQTCREGGNYNYPDSPCYGVTGFCDNRKGQPICKPGQFFFSRSLGAVKQEVCGTYQNSPDVPCQWETLSYAWTCYDCPKDFKPINTTCPEKGDGSHTGACAGCEYPGEQLIVNKTALRSYGYSCVNKGPCAMNDAGRALLEQSEGFCGDFYNIAGHKTIGFGHDCCQKKDCASIKPPITKAEARTILTKDLATAESCIKNVPGVEMMTINQFSAFVDFAYNAGCGRKPYTDKTGNKISGAGFTWVFRNQIAQENWSGICDALPSAAITAGNGTVLEGLKTRRKKEAALCNSPIQTYSGCPTKAKRSLEGDDIVPDRTEDYEFLEARAAAAKSTCKPWPEGAACPK